MSYFYSGSNSFNNTIKLPNNGELRNSGSVTNGMEALADRTVFVSASLTALSSSVATDINSLDTEITDLSSSLSSFDAVSSSIGDLDTEVTSLSSSVYSEVPHISVVYTANSSVDTGTLTVFDTTTHGGTTSTRTSSDISYDATSGNFLVTNAGLYHIVFEVHAVAGSSGNAPILIYINGSSVRSTVQPYSTSAVRNTFVLIEQVGASENIRLDLAAPGGGLQFLQGTSVNIYKIGY